MEGGKGRGEGELSGAARRAAVLTAELAARSEKKVSAVCDHPPGLHNELPEHFEVPNIGGRWLKHPRPR